MFITEHLEGRIQCVNADFVCINLHFKSNVIKSREFIDQIYLNQKSGDCTLPGFTASLSDGTSYDSISLEDEMRSIVEQYFCMKDNLKLNGTESS